MPSPRKILKRPGVPMWKVRSRGRFGNRDGDGSLRSRHFATHAEALGYTAEVWAGIRLDRKLSGLRWHGPRGRAL